MFLVQLRTRNQVQIRLSRERNGRINQDHIQERRDHGQYSAINGIHDQKIEQFVRSGRE
jgi:hypothetical protein